MADRFGFHPKDQQQPGGGLVQPRRLSAIDIPHRGSVSTETSSISAGQTSDMHSSLESIPARPKGVYRLSDFIIERTLGTGSFGRVHLVHSRHNLRPYAVKVLSKERVVKMKQVEHTNNEQQILERIQHPFIINLWGAFQDASNLYMVMDFVAGGELFTLLRRSHRFPDPVAKFYAAEVALALDYLHGLHIIYRDLKPENILLALDGHIKVADFGFAKHCTSVTYTLCGTPDYLAPEVIAQSRYNKSVDWYSLGVLIFEMLSGVPPYHQAKEENPVLLYERINRGLAYINWPPGFGLEATDIIHRLMEPDPSKRIGNMRHGAADVFTHPWFREVDWQKLESKDITAPYIPRVGSDGDASAFERYPDDSEAVASYGRPSDDPWGFHFDGFDYTNPSFMDFNAPLASAVVVPSPFTFGTPMNTIPEAQMTPTQHPIDIH